jgi:hypothetical protein
VGKKEGEQKGSARGSVHWGCYYAGTREEPGTLEPRTGELGVVHVQLRLPEVALLVGLLENIPWFLSFGNRTQNSRVAGARPNHQADRGSDPNHRGIWSPPRAGHGTREEPGTLTQGAPVFPGSSRLGIEPKTPGWLVQDPATRPIGDLIPTIGGSGAHPWRGKIG